VVFGAVSGLMALGVFAISAIGAIALVVNWSPKDD
jgi:hypothetical protein